MKTCSSCKKRKMRNKFGKSTRSKDGLRGQCLVCYNKKKHEWRLANWERDNDIKSRYRHSNPDRVRDANLRQKYGISLIEYEFMFEQQLRRWLWTIAIRPAPSEACCASLATSLSANFKTPQKFWRKPLTM
jgi:hypothetical protein